VGVAVVCTTHFLEIFSRRLLDDGENGIKALRMAVHLPRDEHELAAPLFRLEGGVADSSAGIVCAKMAGLKPSVVARAKEIVIALEEGKTLKPDPFLMFSPAVADVLKVFLSKTSWEDATDAEVHYLRQKIEML
jgi:DNA mismatch repair protein MSH5